MIYLTEEQAQQIEVALNAATLNKDHWLEKCMDSLDTIRAARAQADHIAEADKMVCNWYQDDGDGIWATDCGGVFEIIEGSPSDNDMKFCPYCGKPLEEHPFVDSED